MHVFTTVVVHTHICFSYADMRIQTLCNNPCREMKNLAQDLVNVFPINEFAIRSFSSQITPYPASGEFVGESLARGAIKSMTYDDRQTMTGEALEHTFGLLQDYTYIYIPRHKLPPTKLLLLSMYYFGLGLLFRC